MKTPITRPAAKALNSAAPRGGTPLPPGAHDAGVPGTLAAEATKGAPKREPVTLDHTFVASPSGGPEVKAPHGVRVRNNRTISKR
jgi:hypothetical protein